MGSFNLPPGVTDNMIPGNRPEDEEEKEVDVEEIKVFLNDNETFSGLEGCLILFRDQVYDLRAMIMDIMEEIPVSEAYHLGSVETSGLKLK